MRLLIDDTFATSPYTVPIASGWVSPPPGITVETTKLLESNSALSDDALLAPSSELLRLQQTHVVIPDFAVVADGQGTIAMRTPVRPDEVEATPVRLFDASGTAELLARATLKPFYGIEPTLWLRDDDLPDAAHAQVVIVEGAEALREPEAGFSEDLIRAWFILTAQPVVTHVLLVPRSIPLSFLEGALTYLDATRSAGTGRRSEWRPQVADREGVGRDRASVFWQSQRLKLEPADRQALLDLLQRGSGGTSSPPPRNIEFTDGASTE